MYEYYLNHLSTDGSEVLTARLKPLSMICSRRKYGGALRFVLNGDNPVVPKIQPFNQIEVWWRNRQLGIQSADGGYVLYKTYIYRQKNKEEIESTSLIEFVCQSDWEILNLRRIEWDGGIEGISKFTQTPTEAIGKALVEFNTGTDVSKGIPRKRSGAFNEYTITIVAAGLNGLVTDRGTNGGRLGDILVDIAQNSGGEFVLQKVGNAEWQFDYRQPYLGADKRGSVVFSLANKNMRNPKLKEDYIGRANVGFVVGQRSGDGRAWSAEVRLAGYSPAEDTEGYFDARDVENSASLEGRAEQKLNEQRPRQILEFDVSQTGDTMYTGGHAVPGRDWYDVGDIVSAIYDGEFSFEVVGAELVASNSNDIADVRIDLEQVFI